MWGDEDQKAQETQGTTASKQASIVYVNEATSPVTTEVLTVTGNSMVHEEYTCNKGGKPKKKLVHGNGTLDSSRTTVSYHETDEDGFDGEPLEIPLEFNQDKTTIKYDDEGNHFDRKPSLKRALDSWNKEYFSA